MKAFDIVQQILPDQSLPVVQRATAFAHANVALCKYWGKRDLDLNLPMTSSLSLSLDQGTKTTVTVIDSETDLYFLNGQAVAEDSAFAQRLTKYLNLFRTSHGIHFRIDTENDLPTAAGVASSASGFAALVLALDQLFEWKLPDKELSILARLGSGSASRSLWPGFVKWHCGERDDGMDSFSETCSEAWNDLKVGVLLLSNDEKPIGSREAMQQTVDTSRFYAIWPDQVAHDLEKIEQAIHARDFELLGRTAESNALAMHATMLAAVPPICYFKPETIAAMEQVWQLRADGLLIYFTEDAGPNLKLLFLSKDEATVRATFELL